MKRILIILVILVVGVGGYFIGTNNSPSGDLVNQTAQFENEPSPIQASALNLVTIPEDAVFGVRSYRVQKPNGWASIIEYSPQGGDSVLRLLSPDYHDGPDDAYDSFQEGVSIAITEMTNDQDKSVSDVRARLEKSEMFNTNPIEATEVSAQPAIRYYWGWEGNPAMVTKFFRGGKSYSVVLAMAAPANIPEMFEPYMSLYEAVLDSFEFK